MLATEFLIRRLHSAHKGCTPYGLSAAFSLEILLPAWSKHIEIPYELSADHYLRVIKNKSLFRCLQTNLPRQWWLLPFTIPDEGAEWFSLQLWHQINVKHHYIQSLMQGQIDHLWLYIRINALWGKGTVIDQSMVIWCVEMPLFFIILQHMTLLRKNSCC